MRDPYEILGVPSTADDEKIKAAYHALARRYHPDNYVDATAEETARAVEKMKEINEAYDRIQQMRSGHTGAGKGKDSAFTEVRQKIRHGQFADAELMLDGYGTAERTAEWHYLKSVLLARRGWQNDALREIEIACTMDPANQEYREARDYYHRRAQSFGTGYGGPTRPYDTAPRTGGECSTCDMCQGLICADCCCECMGGDLIRCI